MKRKEAMEWASKALPKALLEDLADLFQEATNGLYRIGEEVKVMKGNVDWSVAVVKAITPTNHYRQPELVRHLPEKRPATREELNKRIDGRMVGAEKLTLETLQMMARDLGISTEVDCE